MPPLDAADASSEADDPPDPPDVALDELGSIQSDLKHAPRTPSPAPSSEHVATPLDEPAVEITLLAALFGLLVLPWTWPLRLAASLPVVWRLAPAFTPVSSLVGVVAAHVGVSRLVPGVWLQTAN